MMTLSPHFTLAEMTASDTARREGIANTPSAAHIEALRQLCEQHVLEPVRAHFGRPVRITSGYRSPKLCLAVGSSVRSQHAKGEAADFEITGVPNHRWRSGSATT